MHHLSNWNFEDIVYNVMRIAMQYWVCMGSMSEVSSFVTQCNLFFISFIDMVYIVHWRAADKFTPVLTTIWQLNHRKSKDVLQLTGCPIVGHIYAS